MNLRRLWAIMLKELRQLRRDRITLAMIVGMFYAGLCMVTVVRVAGPRRNTRDPRYTST